MPSQLVPPIKPASSAWVYKGQQPTWPHAHIFDHLDGTRILSGVENVSEDGMNYHISVSRLGKRLSAADARQVLMGLKTNFPVEQWFEDNHASSIARNYWVHVDPAKRKPCECVAKEKPNVEGDFTWREVQK